MKRRTFIIATGGLLGSTGLQQACASTDGLPANVPAATVRMAGYSGLAGTSFTATKDRGSSELHLLSVKQVPARPGMEQFTLLFESPAGLESGLYSVEHAATGPVDMYLELAGAGASGARCRADFSLLV